MKKYLLVLPLIFAFALVLSGCARQPLDLQPRAVSGLLDLSGWDLSADGSVRLSGEWAFYWDQLLTAEDIGSRGRVTGYFEMPGYWTDYPDMSLPSHGKATYRLLVRGIDEDQILSIRLPPIFTEHCIWVNGQKINGNGSLAGIPFHYLSPAVFDINAGLSEYEIIIQIQNASHINAGIGQDLIFGTSDLIRSDQWARASADLVLCLICLVAGAYHLFAFMAYFRRRELAYFGILCLAVCARGLLLNEALLMQFIPQLSYAVGARVVNLTVPVIVIAGLLYTFTLYKEDVPGLIGETLMAINVLFAGVIVAAEPFVTSSFFKPFLVTVVSAGLLALFISVKVAVKRRPDAWYYLIGMVFLAAATANDTLHFMRLVSTSYLLTAGVSVFVFSQVLLLSNRMAGIYRVAEKLAGDLSFTRDLAIKNETAFLGVQMKPHFLYNALNTIADCCRTDPAQAEELILSLSRYLRGTLDFENLGDVVTLGKELELVTAYTSIEMARFENFSVNYEIEPGLQGVRLPPLTLQPLVENAIKHGIRKMASGGRVDIVIRRLGENIRICVTDNGEGIPAGNLPGLLQARANAGVGLFNIHTRLLRLFGRGLVIDSKPGSGTRVSFEIPWKEGA